MNLEWLCYHIHYQADFNCLLTDCISPLLTKLEYQKYSYDYFFLRYWKNGPHLRLRIKIDHKNKFAIKDTIEQTITDHLEQYPSESSINEHTHYESSKKFAALENDTQNEFACIANNSLHQADYNPELHKYGGPIGMQIAEEIFIVSSKLAMYACVQKVDKFIYGITMMFFATKAFQLSLPEMQRFFQAYYQYWLRYGQPDQKTKLRLEHLLSQNRLKKLLYEIQVGHTVKNLSPWLLSLSTAHHKLTQNLEEITTYLTDLNAQQYPIQYLLTQYIHTNNNRLGVLATEEALLGYLAMSTVQQLIENRNTYDT